MIVINIISMALLFTVLSFDNVGLQVGFVGATFVVGDLNLQLAVC